MILWKNYFDTTNEIPWFSQLNKWLLLHSWEVLRSPQDVSKFFSYYWAHVLEWTFIGSGWFNTNECVDWSPLMQYILWYRCSDRVNDISLWNQWLISDNPQVIETFKKWYQKQYPLKAWVFWSDLEAIYWDGNIKNLLWFVPVVVDHILQNDRIKESYKQTYIVWIAKNKWPYNVWRSEVMVWTREKLYSAFKEIFGEEFPLSNIYDDFCFKTEEDIIKLRMDLINPDGILYSVFERAIREWKIEVIAINNGNYHIKISSSWEEWIMKLDWSFEKIN